MNPTSRYDPTFVRDLFDEMSGTYGLTNTISSFGFCRRWRRQCVELAEIRPGMVVYDLMTGMGECWDFVRARLAGRGSLVALDFSAAMCAQAREKAAGVTEVPVEVLEQDMLANSIPEESADCVVSVFGLKTFSHEQQRVLAGEVARILRPGGTFALAEISVPPSRVLRAPYFAYLHYCIPPIGRVFMGNPDNYRMLGVYTEAFESCAAFQEMLLEAGLESRLESLFFGCATAVRGRKPGRASAGWHP